MKYRVVDLNGYYFPTYFKTKREALACLEKKNGNFGLERKIGGEWFPHH